MLDEIRHFLLIAEHGTFRAAARHAHLSQPALTASIQRLERAFGTRLLLRGRHGAEPTAAGAELIPRARAALAALEDARRAVAEISGLEAGEVRIGASSTAATYLLPPVLAHFRTRYPGVRIVLRELRDPDMRDAIDRGTLDLAIAHGSGGEPWQTDEFILVGAPSARNTAGPFITSLPGTTTRAELDRHFPGATVVMELGSMAAIKGHVREGIGIALISRAAVEQELEARRLIELAHPATPIPRRFVLVHRGKDRLPPAAAALRDTLVAVRNADTTSAHAARRRRAPRR
ncbi:MAG TPA: LysR family transcriptional regulator [Polyangiaceae bacterium]